MNSFFLVAITLLLAPAVAFVLVVRVGPKLRKMLLTASRVSWPLVLAGSLLGFRLAPPPLGAIAVAIGLGAFWVVFWNARPGSDAPRGRKTLYRIGAAALLVLNYSLGTVGVLGLGFAMESSRPHARVNLTPTTVVYAFRVGGPGVDFNGYEVQVRSTIPIIGVLEHISQRRGYERRSPGEMTPPTFTLSGRDGSIEVLVTLGDWAGEGYPSPDTIRLDRPEP